MPTYPFNVVRKSLFRKAVRFFDGVLAIRSAFSNAAIAVVEIIEPGVLVGFFDAGAFMVAHKSRHPGGVRLCFCVRVESVVRISRSCTMGRVA